MQGKIGFSSEPGIGSEFWFDLPLEISNHREEVRQHLLYAEKINLLIVSDHESKLKNVTNYFTKYALEISYSKFSTISAETIAKQIIDNEKINLLVIDFPMTMAGYCDFQHQELVKKIIHLIEQSRIKTSITTGLIIPYGLSSKLADELIISLGLTGVLHAPIQESHLENYMQLYLAANAINENKNITKINQENHGHIQDDEATQHHGVARAHILIAEDNPVNRKVLQKILDRAGYHYSIAKDGDEALDLIDKTKFDAIVLDMNMPGMSGLEIARIYNIISGKDERAPMIMFSANVTPDAKESSLKAGVDEFLPKPVKIDIFLEVLSKLLAKKQIDNHKQSTIRNDAIGIVEKNKEVIELKTLLDLEEVSSDPIFLDELIQEFITENKKTILKFEDAMRVDNIEDVKDILHYLKGAAVSVGAMELLRYCKKLEKLNAQEINKSKENVVFNLKNYSMNLCDALENYRFQRRRKNMTLVPSESLVATLARTAGNKNHNNNINS